jgi:hypothetical protein
MVGLVHEVAAAIGYFAKSRHMTIRSRRMANVRRVDASMLDD